MKVCLLIWNYWPGPEGGAERQCRLLAHALAAAGASCTIITHWSDIRQAGWQTDGQTQIHRLGLLGPATAAVMRLLAAAKRRRFAPAAAAAAEPARAPQRRFGLSTPWIWLDRGLFILALWRHLARNRKGVDVLHVHESHWLAGVGAWLGRRLNLPVVVKECSYPVLMTFGPDVPFYRTWLAWRLRPRYIAQTRAASDGLIAAGVPAAAVEVLPNGVSMPEASADPATGQEVLYVGNLYQGQAWKGFDVLLEAWSQVHADAPALRLVLVGGGDATELKQMADRLKIQERVVFAGRSDDVASFYARAAFVVLPSRREGMSNVLLEAASWGLPAVASDIPGNAAVVQDGVTGLLFPSGSVAACAAALRRLCQEPARRVTLGQAARRRAQAEFDMNAVARRHLELYRRLAAPRA